MPDTRPTIPQPVYVDEVQSLGGGVAGHASARGVYLVTFDQVLTTKRPIATIPLVTAEQLAEYVSVQAHREPRLAILAAKCWRAHLEIAALYSAELDAEERAMQLRDAIVVAPGDYTITVDGAGLEA